MDGFFNFFSQILRPIEWVVSWILVLAHQGLTAIGMPETSGWTWALSIVALVVCIRIVLIPLFVRQIKASRGLQLIQPEMKKIQAKYKGKSDQASKEAMTRETMALYKSSGTNPLASCLPLLLQSPIFFALFNVLNGLTRMADGTREPVGGLTRDLAAQAESSTLFGARLSETFLRTDDLNVQILTVILIVLMSATTFTTQRQLMRKNMPASSLEGNPFAQQQKILLYVLPLVFAVSGVNFPIGVLLYWLTTNVWSMGQQFFVIRRMPAPGSLAEKALNERRAKKGKPLFGAAPAEPDPEPVVEQPKGQRVQPKRRDRQRRPAGASDVAAMTPMTARADLTKPARTGAAPRPGVAAGGTGTPAKGARRKGAAQKQVRARGATAVQRSATDDPGASSR